MEERDKMLTKQLNSSASVLRLRVFSEWGRRTDGGWDCLSMSTQAGSKGRAFTANHFLALLAYCCCSFLYSCFAVVIIDWRASSITVDDHHHYIFSQWVASYTRFLVCPYNTYTCTMYTHNITTIYIT